LIASAALVGYTDWPGLQQVMRLERRTLNKQKQILRHEIAYGVTSLSPERASPDQLLKLWREHWHIENKLHYVRDVTFDEDRSQVRSEHIPQVMAAFRNVTISLSAYWAGQTLLPRVGVSPRNPTWLWRRSESRLENE